ncbi:MAG TPA: hypothetical protein VK642_10415 [Burkholderiales bacterium]|nr:hypothetical protein [Burkholderiales bacterium]
MQRLIQLLLALALSVASLNSAGADFTFAALGDTPYTEEEESRFVSMIAEINREKLAFAVHVGDFKSGWSPCSDAVYLQRRDWFALFHQALIYTPGDNEWTDCWRALGAARDPLESLKKLRSLFFTDGYSLGQQKIALARQSAAYPEHARWAHEGIVFATLNVPGSSNNARMPEEFTARSDAVNAWIAGTFDIARKQARGAVVLVIHANPFAVDGRIRKNYTGLLNTITKETLNFSGEVLLIHGDTHRYRMDQPLMIPQTNRLLKNFTRLEVFGYPSVNWVRVRVSQQDGKVAFTTSPGG